MLKRKINKLIAATLSLSFLFSLPLTANAAVAQIPKDENVYAILGHNGEVNNIYVVNSFESDTEASFTDYGDYNSLRNLSNTNELQVQDGKITSTVPKGRFYYQGDFVSKELPWNIEIDYKLDNKEIKPEDLIGKSGKVEISIDVTKNEKVKDVFFNNYTLQISTSLDGKKFSDIMAEGATIANAGNNKSINFSLLPGDEKTFMIKADVENFELNPIQFNGVLLAMDINLEGTDTMTEDVVKLSDGISKLNDGAEKLKDGSENYYKGLNSLAGNTGKITSSSTAIGSAISDTSKGLAELLKSTAQLNELATAMLKSTDPQTQALAKGYLSQAKALEQISAGLTSLSGQYTQFDAGVGQLAGGINSLNNGYKELNSGISKLSEGTKELSDNTSGMDTKIQNKIDSMVSDFSHKDFKPVSFVSPDNKNIGAVQFAIRTDALKIPEAAATVEEEKAPLTFWQKLLNLFGLYKEEE